MQVFWRMGPLPARGPPGEGQINGRYGFSAYP